jgi:hypothetical protein
MVVINVSDTYSLITDLDPYPGFCVTKKLKKFTAEKQLKYFFDQNLQFTYP